MLKALSIKNFALIESLEIDFSNNLSVITGETGSGKSILLGALGLVLGSRVDVTSLKDKSIKCVIEANFSITNYNLQDFFAQNDIDYEQETTIRREILPTGKSRAFVNDSPVTVAVLTELGNVLLDIHSQHQTRSILEMPYQFEVVDTLANTKELLGKYTSALSNYKKNKQKLTALQLTKQNSLKDQDYNTHLLNELTEAKLRVGEQENLEETFEKLNHVEVIKVAVEKILALANHENVGILTTTKEIKTSLTKIAPFSKQYAELLERLTSVFVEYEDIIQELENAMENIVDDPEQLEIVNQKLQLLYALQKKHQVSKVEELCEIREKLQQEVLQFDSVDEEILKLEKEINDNFIALQLVANQINELRQAIIPVFTEKITQLLSRLGMPDAQMTIDLQLTEDFYPNGSNQIAFLFSANKGSNVGTIKKVASGGELSRIMLAIKAILAQYAHLPTIIFDEIDTGVSGEIANKIGDIMQEMSQYMQVFAITHLPQVASKGNQHYKVFKSSTDVDTVSELKLLNKQERIIEIAEMLSGKNISESALIHAKSLLN